MPSDVFQQYRRIDVGNVQAVADGSPDDLDMSVEVRYGQKSGLSFKASLWNLKRKTWSSISEGDPIRITLGWENGPRSSVCLGRVEEKETAQDGADVEYILRGIDESKGQASKKLSHTWRDRSPDQIAADLARRADLTVAQAEPVGGMIRGNWAVKRDRPLRYWFDQLTKEAEKRTGKKWEWLIQTGKFYFVPMSWHSSEVVILSYDNTLLTMDEASGKSESDSKLELDFRCLCEPHLRKNGIVSVQTDEWSGTYKVTDIKFVSDTVSGDHYVEGTITPGNARYTTDMAAAGPGRKFISNG